ncbi:MAG: hypothetical protein EXQ52_16795 [Bryobacterales bacterium]|nr:hypothetical protein [Bryobacterales bacterium]
MNSAVGRADGLTDSELDALADAASSTLFTPAEQAALAYAETVTRDSSVPDGLFENLRARFSEEQIVEMTATITWEICAAKFNRALAIEAQGVCRLHP